MTIIKRFLALLLAALTMGPATAADCGGVAGTGRRIGVDGPVTLTAEEAAGLYVASSGYWTRCPAAQPARAPGDCPAQTQGFRVWAVGSSRCTTATKYADPLARDRALRHGEVAGWQQWQGSMRGVLGERCDDGQRIQVLATCYPAAK